MNDKKHEIKRMAVQLISERGYHQTSVQEIAKQCNVSKGAFYKHFDSKDNLLIEILKDHHKELFQKVQLGTFSNSLSKIEVFTKRITIELDLLEQNKSFILILFKEFPPSEMNVISEMMEDFRKKLMDWHKHLLLETFGEKIRPIIWDLVTCLEGVIKEYQSLILFYGMTISKRRIAAFITTSMKVITDSADDLDPVIMPDIRLHKVQTFSLKDQLEQHLFKMETKINTLDIPNQEKNKLLASLEMLKEETHQEHPKDYLLEALTHYLKTNDELRKTSEQLETVITKLYGKGDI